MQEILTKYLLEKSGILDSLTYATSKITDTAQCQFTEQSPNSILDWSFDYISDPNTDIIINRLTQYSKYIWIRNKLAKVETI